MANKEPGQIGKQQFSLMRRERLKSEQNGQKKPKRPEKRLRIINLFTPMVNNQAFHIHDSMSSKHPKTPVDQFLV